MKTLDAVKAHRRMLRAGLGVIGAVALLGMTLRAQVAAGYETDTIDAAQPGAFVGGFAVLPGGSYALFDGASVVEISAKDGSFVRTLYTPPSFVFGAFIAVDPTETWLYFGESSFGNIVEVELSTLSSRLAANVPLPFDLAFDPLGRAFLSWTDSFVNPGRVSLLGLDDGSLDDVILTSDASGPLGFDAAGDLLYVQPDTSSFPPPPDQSELLRFTRSQIESAIGNGELSSMDGEVLGLLDGGFGLAVDESGDVLVSDSVYSKITEIDVETLEERLLWSVGYLFVGDTFVDFIPPDQGAFERFQPGTSGELVTIESDFVSFNFARRIRPRRPSLSTTPASPIPVGPFVLELKDGPANGFALVLVGGGTTAESQYKNSTWPAPLFVGLSFPPFFLLLLPLDARGGFALNADNPGFPGVTLGAQVVVGESASGPFFGTSQPLDLMFQ